MAKQHWLQQQLPTTTNPALATLVKAEARNNNIINNNDNNNSNKLKTTLTAAAAFNNICTFNSFIVNGLE